MENLWLNIIYSIIGIVLSTALGFLAKWIKSKFSTEQIELAKEIASIAVNAVEQMAKTLGWNSQEKYDQAVNYLIELGKKVGLALTPDQIKGLIESAVLNLKDWYSEL